MTTTELKLRVLKYKWEPWLHRPFGAFILSLFRNTNRKEIMGLYAPKVEWPAFLFQESNFYKSEEVWDLFVKRMKDKISPRTIFKLCRACEQVRRDGLIEIQKLIKNQDEVIIKLKKIKPIFIKVFSFIWWAHGLEQYYKPIIRQKVAQYYSGDTDKIVGDLLYPSKKNTHVYFDQALRSTMPLTKVQQKYGWIKARDGFSSGFSLSELARARQRLRSEQPKKFKIIKVKKSLRSLVNQGRELVYFRTLRTDVLYELLFAARPILKEAAKKYKIYFKDLRHYDIDDLISGHLKKYSEKVGVLVLGKHFKLFDSQLFKQKKITIKKLSGASAYLGIVSGKAKVVLDARQINKVKSGDILIAPTTAPSYILGMKRAAAFVTDEGGITSHAAIVSREMHKPCVIGTKTATKVFKDGDLIEVDANQGIVRKL